MQTKQLFITFAAAALCLSGVLTFSGCKKENESEPQKYTVKLNSQKETVTVGKTVELTATVTPSDGASAVWTSGDEKVAKVTGSALKGTVTGVAEGETCIYCTVNGQFKDSCKVTVRLAIYPEAPELECVKIGNTVWAPVNCGYDSTGYKYGKLYQWGRKDGCGYNDGSTYKEAIIQVTASGPVAASSEEASKFYTNGSSPYDWLTPQDSTRWNNNLEWPGKETSPKKTDYDPCPDGWRVPTAAELTSLLGSHTGGDLQEGTGVHSDMKGYWFDGSTTSEPTSGLFLPAAGIRSCDVGYANDRGSYGDYWSSSVSGYDARDLYFLSGDASMSHSSRAGGYSVRCVQE